MAILQVTTAPSREAYDAVETVVDLSGRRPAGMLVHAAAQQADGTILIVDLWEAEAAMEAFEQGLLFPAFAATDVPRSAPPSRYPTFHLVEA